ncbi:hypothetical protein LTS08_003183 [Lithohypha guttulata]|nr:hypothetical protein LTS08_003183 [Lithohypha guttulata]
MCEISGYGSDGPYKTKKAYDLLVQSEAGLLSITGTPDEPCKVGASIADIAAGMYAYSSIMAALLQRQKTGKGCRIDNTTLRSQNRTELYQIICDRFKENMAVEVVEKLEKAGIANAKLNSMNDVWEHPQLEARNRFAEVETEAGFVKTSIPPGMSGDVQARLEPVPAIGQHNEKILREFGLEKKTTQQEKSEKDVKMSV